jgi:CheY-like chemotaxis protein
MKRPIESILVVEDDGNDRLLLQLAFSRIGITDPITFVQGGAEALAYLRGEAEYCRRERYPYPSFLITDLKMPGLDGFSVLAHLKENPEHAIMPTIVLSASSDPDDIRLAYAMGAHSYLVKPVELEELFRLLKMTYDYWRSCDFPYTDTNGKHVCSGRAGKLGQLRQAPGP